MFRRESLHKDFHALIGEITLAHADVEQELKAELIMHWDVAPSFLEKGKEIKIEDFYSEYLRKRFLKEIKIRCVPEQYIEEYNKIFSLFISLCAQRNETIKSTYSFDDKNRKVHRMKNTAFAKKFLSGGHKDFSGEWLEEVDFKELKKLRDDLYSVQYKFSKLAHKIFQEKFSVFTKIIQTYPTPPFYAEKNPYLYLDIVSKVTAEQTGTHYDQLCLENPTFLKKLYA